MSKRKNSAVSILLWVVVAFLLLSALATALQGLPDIGDPGDDTTVTDDQGNVVPDPDNPGTSTGNGRIENLKMYPAYAATGSREQGYYGFSITDLNPNTTYSLYLSFVNDEYHSVHLVFDGNCYYHMEENEGYGEYNENTLRYGVGALKLRTDANGILTVYCMMETDPNYSTLEHDVYAAEYFERYAVALYTTEDEPSEPVELPGKITFHTEKILYDYVAPTTPDSSGSSSNSGSSGPDHSGTDPVYVLDGKYHFNDGLTASDEVLSLFDGTSQTYRVLEETFSSLCYCNAEFEDSCIYSDPCNSNLSRIRITFDHGEIFVCYGSSKDSFDVYTSDWVNPWHQCLIFDEAEVSEAFYYFLMENAIKVS